MVYEDQEIRPNFAHQVQDQLLGYMALLDAALKSGDSGVILSALNKVVVEYAGSRGLI